MRDFVKELDSIIKKVDNKSFTTPLVERFNIHKRSLPIEIDKLVLFNVTKDEALWWVKHKLQNKKEDDRVIYFDIIPVNATAKQKSIFYNPEKFYVGGNNE